MSLKRNNSMIYVRDPVGTGLIASLARPGGNVTGVSGSAGLELFAKQLELLKETVPKIRRVAILSNPDNAYHQLAIREVNVAARSLGVQLQLLEARGPNEFDGAFAAMATERVGAPDSADQPSVAAELAGLRLPVRGERELVVQVAGRTDVPDRHCQPGARVAHGAVRLKHPLLDGRWLRGLDAIPDGLGHCLLRRLNWPARQGQDYGRRQRRMGVFRPRGAQRPQPGQRRQEPAHQCPLNHSMLPVSSYPPWERL